MYQSNRYLAPDDINPVEFIPATTTSPLLIVCDHAGLFIPKRLKAQSLSSEGMSQHIASDIGAKALAHSIAANLDAPLVTQRYSRLVIDMNRSRTSPQLAPESSDGTTIPFNQNLSEAELDSRWQNIHRPYHNRIAKILDSMSDSPNALVAIHSFTPQLHNAPPRNWHIDLMSRTHVPLAETLQTRLQNESPDLNIGINQVFQMSDTTDYTLPHHAEPRNIPNVSIEVRNDLLSDSKKIERMSRLLAKCLIASLLDEFKALYNQMNFRFPKPWTIIPTYR